MICKNDEFGLAIPNSYIAIKLTEEQTKFLKSKQLEKLVLFGMDNISFFQIKDENGNWTNESMIYLVLLEKPK